MWNECVCVGVSKGEASICTFVITVRKCLFVFDWVGPVGTLSTFKQTISASCLKSLSGRAEEERKKNAGEVERWSVM